jgi:hypothetical protein
VKLLPKETVEPLIRTLLFANIELVIVPTSLDVINAPDVEGNVITLPLVVEMLDVFTVAADKVPVTVTLEKTFDMIETPLA